MTTDTENDIRSCLRAACADDLNQFVNKKNIYLDEWSNLISKIEDLSKEQNFEALIRLNELMEEIREQNPNGELSSTYNYLCTELDQVAKVLEYSVFKW